MHLAVLILAAATAVLASDIPILSNQVIYQPPSNSNTILYPRHVELEDETLLVTASLFNYTPAFFPIFQSKDHGKTWTWISNMTDQVNGFGMPAHPALTELTEPLFGYEKGTIFAAGNSWNANNTKIDLYASKDKAQSWEFVSHIAAGTGPNTTNGATPIWEPYLLIYEKQMVAFYSDSRDPKHGQKLAHQVSTDLKTWGPVVNDVAVPEYAGRPGMTVMDYIKPIDKWILVHENPIGNEPDMVLRYGKKYPVYYHLATSPLEFYTQDPEGTPIVINGTAPNASPYVVWTPVGGANGTIIVSDADTSDVFTNQFGAAADKWERHSVPQPDAYSRALHIFKGDPNRLMILGGSTFDGMGNGTPLTFSTVDVLEMLKK